MSCSRILLRGRGGLAVRLAFSLFFLGAIPSSRGVEDARGIARILEDMRARGKQFDPAEFLALGKDGLAGLLDVLLPESAGAALLTDKAVNRCIEELGHAQYSRRRDAIARLVSIGAYVREQVEAAATNADIETSVNAKEVLRSISSAAVTTNPERNAAQTRACGEAYGRYLAKLQDDECWRLIAMRTTLALFAGRNSTGSTDDFMWQSFTVMAGKGKDEALSLFRPVIQLRDESLSIWVFTTIRACCPAGFTPTVLKQITGTDHVYNSEHLSRMLKHRRENSFDVPYRPDPKEVQRAFDDLWKMPNGPGTKTFLSYEESAMELLYSLPEDRRYVEVETANAAHKGVIAKGKARDRCLTLQAKQQGAIVVPLKDISMLRPASE